MVEDRAPDRRCSVWGNEMEEISDHRSAPIESVAMSKQGLTVMFFYKCPATYGHLIAKYIKCTQTRYISCTNSFQHIYVQLLYGLQLSLGSLS
jgi:hypothetical protein